MKISQEAKFVMDSLLKGLEIESKNASIGPDIEDLRQLLMNPPFYIFDSGHVILSDGYQVFDVFFSTYENDEQIDDEETFLRYLIDEKKGEIKFTYQESIAIRNRVLPIVEMLLL